MFVVHINYSNSYTSDHHQWKLYILQNQTNQKCILIFLIIQLEIFAWRKKNQFQMATTWLTAIINIYTIRHMTHKTTQDHGPGGEEKRKTNQKIILFF